MSKWRRFDQALAPASQESKKTKIIQTSAVFILAGVFFTTALAVSTAIAGNYGLQESEAEVAADKFAAQLCRNSSPGRTGSPANCQLSTPALRQKSLSVQRGVDEGNKFIAQSAGMSIGGAVYDPMRRIVKIVETTGGTVTSTKQFIWAGDQLCEERDASGNVTRRFFALGEQIAGTNYYYTRDHNSSVHEMTNGAGAIQSQYGYGPWGEVSKLAGIGPEATMQYAGMYKHERSGLNLAVNRAYSPSQGKFISRDPIDDPGFYITPRTEEPDDPGASMTALGFGQGSAVPHPNMMTVQMVSPDPWVQTQLAMMMPANPFLYTRNNPIKFRDPSGLQQTQAPGIQDPKAGPNSPYYQRPPYCSCPLKKYEQHRGPGGTGPHIQNFDWGDKPKPEYKCV